MEPGEAQDIRHPHFSESSSGSTDADSPHLVAGVVFIFALLPYSNSMVTPSSAFQLPKSIEILLCLLEEAFVLWGLKPLC